MVESLRTSADTSPIGQYQTKINCGINTLCSWVELSPAVPRDITSLTVEYVSQLRQELSQLLCWGGVFGGDDTIQVEWMDPLYSVYFDVPQSWYAQAQGADWVGRNDGDAVQP